MTTNGSGVGAGRQARVVVMRRAAFGSRQALKVASSDLVDVVEGCELQQALVRDNRVESLHLLAAARDKSDVGISRWSACAKR